MKFAASVSAVMAACALTASSVAADGAEGVPWGYKLKDKTMASPDQWAEHYPTCGGDSQSPIDIVVADSKVSKKAQSSLRFRGQCAGFNLTQTEETFKGAVVDGTCKVRANDAIYDLAQFHVHVPSEHTVNGEPLDGEVHFVHSNKNGSALIVVGVFMEIDPAGDTDPWLESVIDGIDDVTPYCAHDVEPVRVLLCDVCYEQMSKFLMPSAAVFILRTSYSAVIKKSVKAGTLFNYPGSLTTPGCDEIVDWWVVEKPIKVSPKDLTRIQDNQGELHITEDGKNARPVQLLNKRTVTQFK